MATNDTILEEYPSTQVKKEPFYNKYPTRLGLFVLLLLIAASCSMAGSYV